MVYITFSLLPKSEKIISCMDERRIIGRQSEVNSELYMCAMLKDFYITIEGQPG